MKDTLEVLIIFATSGWLITISLITTPSNNIMSKLIFKVIPFFLGLGCLYVGCRMTGLIP